MFTNDSPRHKYVFTSCELVFYWIYIYTYILKLKYRMVSEEFSTEEWRIHASKF